MGATDTATRRAIPAGFESAHVTPDGYRKMYEASISDPASFWGEEGKRLDWI